ncbi:MAG TPA: hypothetical protein VHM88_11345, partial [Candidatus Acidoferrales bacterium]|nr:hypothetical protein [Candidatus Acidoferrales bacterium]
MKIHRIHRPSVMVSVLITCAVLIYIAIATPTPVAYAQLASERVNLVCAVQFTPCHQLAPDGTDLGTFVVPSGT